MLKKLFSFTQPKKPEQEPLMSDALRVSILHSLGLKSVPVMPGAAQQAFTVATNPSAEAHDFVAVIEADEGLSSRVLKIANSVFYNRGGGSQTITEAVQVLGMSELRNLLNATTLANLFPVKHPLRAEFWAHNVATAITARVLARSLLSHKVEQMFLAGLMHDLGKLLLLQQHVDNYERVVKQALADGLEAPQAEVKTYPFDHTHVGQLVAEKWRFSRELYDAIGDHHKPWQDISLGSITGIIKLSDALVHATGLGAQRDVPAYQRIYSPLLDDAWHFFKVPMRDQKQLMQEVSLDFNAEFQTYETWGRA
jgi:putative nucleotidyltransferase with HDIG domain